ncbi:MAG: T9SS type A sorting domain-containing protein [Bacteroidales bacterium]|nr:T9SS type A sorting domain-containing protein [Bacteroidales bacterium]
MKRRLLNSLLPLVFAVFIGLQSRATSLTVSGEVSGTWNVDTVLVVGDLLIPNSQTLIIEPGTRVEFQSYFRLDVMGCLRSVGTMADSIVFTIRDTSNFYAQTSGRGGWSGIRFISTDVGNDSSLLLYNRLEFGKAAEDSVNCYGGAIQVQDFSKLRISRCLFYHNYSFYSGGAVYLRNSDIPVEECCFRNNYSGNTGTIYGYGGGICGINASPKVCNNTFYSNSSTGVGGAVSFDNCDPEFSNNAMYSNFSALGGGFGILRSSPSKTMVNNLVVENNALFFGGGACCIRSFPVFSNLTISGNNSAYGGGFYCNDSAAPSMYNSIIYGNYGFGNSVYIWDIRSAPSFYYCNIEGDSSGFEGSGGHEGYHGEYLNNLNLDPMFIGSGLFPWQLLSGSPCINAGTPDPVFLLLPETDLAGAPRIWSGHLDMGAYEYNGTTGITFQESLQYSGIEIFPNPISESTQIRFESQLETDTRCQLYSSSGVLMSCFAIKKGVSECNLFNASAQCESLSAGIYLLKCNYKGRMITRMLVKNLD